MSEWTETLEGFCICMAFVKLYHEGKIGAEKDIAIAKKVKTAQTRSSHVSQCVSLLGDHFQPYFKD